MRRKLKDKQHSERQRIQPRILYPDNLPTKYNQRTKIFFGYPVPWKYTTYVTLLKNLPMYVHKGHE